MFTMEGESADLPAVAAALAGWRAQRECARDLMYCDEDYRELCRRDIAALTRALEGLRPQAEAAGITIPPAEPEFTGRNTHRGTCSPAGSRYGGPCQHPECTYCQAHGFAMGDVHAWLLAHPPADLTGWQVRRDGRVGTVQRWSSLPASGEVRWEDGVVEWVRKDDLVPDQPPGEPAGPVHVAAG